MSTFNEREKSFEKKFAMDEELKFKAEARRNKLLGLWIAEKLGLSGAAVDDYVKAVRKADLSEKGDEDVFRKVRKDLDDKGVALSDKDLRKAMDEFLAQAAQQLQAEAKSRAEQSAIERLGPIRFALVPTAAKCTGCPAGSRLPAQPLSGIL